MNAEDFKTMYESANAFYKTLGNEQTHALWLGEEMPEYFFIFLLRYCTLLHTLRAWHIKQRAFQLAPCD